MAYDTAKDKVLTEEKVSVGDKERIVLGVYQYDNQEPKLGMVREVDRKDGVGFNKLGRLTADELRAIAPALQKQSGVLFAAADRTKAVVPKK